MNIQQDLYRAKYLGASLAVLVVAFASPPAVAQTAAKAVTVVDELVVTAQRREESLHDIPIAISAFNTEMLKKNGIEDTRDLTLIAPSLNFTQSATGPQPTIRGIGTRGSAIGDESVVPIFIDGAYQPFLLGYLFDFSAIDRVEVLRGPQSALYGRNATGGAINIITRDPKVQPEAELGFRYGSFNTTDLTGYAGGGNDKVATGLAVRWRRDDGYGRDLVTGAHLATSENFNLRWKTILQATDNLKVILTLSHNESLDNAALSTQPINGDTIGRRLDPNTVVSSAPYHSAFTFVPFNKILLNSAGATVKWQLSSAEITSVTNYTYGRLHGSGDNDSTPALAQEAFFYLSSSSLYQEIYATSHWDRPLNWTVGAVYFRDSSRAHPQFSEIATLTPGANFGVITETTLNSRQGTNSYAAYAEIQYTFNPQWELIAGGRYTTEKKDFTVRSVAVNDRTGVMTIVAPLPADKTWSQFTPTATLKFSPNTDLQFYARAGKGFKSGLFNTLTTVTASVNPEKLTQYEIGAKARPMPGFDLSGAIYYTKQSDVQLTARDPITGGQFLQNAASTEVYGAEAEAVWRVTPDFNVRGNVSVLNGRYTSFPNATVTLPATSIDPAVSTTCIPGTGVLIGGNRSVVCNVTDNSIIRTPFFMTAASADYTTHLNFGELLWSGTVYHAGHSFWDPLNRLREPPYTLVGARVQWNAPDKKYDVAVGVDNLFDEYHNLSQTTSTLTDIRSNAQPRFVYVEARGRF